jgi:hypothetical protein
MAGYKYQKFLVVWDSAEFDKTYSPGVKIAWSGIYRCDGCGRESVHTVDKPLPPQNHHQHSIAQGSIKWRLIVTDAPDPI